MAPAKKRREKHCKPLAGELPELLETAIAENRDFILTTETDPDTGRRMLHVMSGKFVSPCMLRKLIGQAESQRDEGGTLISREW
ncbi:hypothetical protein [Methanoregula sp.]|uniref:hypothetical protein n=1 Tax=Methanoregula sp. TaxID=2052170 RepID=UPI0035685D5C